MFKNTNFIAESPTMIRPSRSKFTAEGIVSTPCDDSSLRKRNLNAVLKLPDLKERTSMSSMEGLYELSQKLAVTSPRLTKFFKDPEQPEEITDPDMVRGLENTPQKREEQPEATVQQPKVKGRILLFKQHQELKLWKSIIRNPINRNLCEQVKNKLKNKTKKKKKKKDHLPARVKAVLDLKRKNYINLLRKPTGHGASKYLKRFVASKVLPWLLTFGIAFLVYVTLLRWTA
ncbi:uncharacterized protein LOC113565516 isoform X1 [Drosophila persimilis]|uniref:uncharacterized protein LOC113565516 isoform X1 n=1 Tax=Drosophila persimilis TaxID=7234 RepID=UPI000F07DA62|nr:uncharacterized protein LOC113565516 isoform X1 [Drosophila persimilis]